MTYEERLRAVSESLQVLYGHVDLDLLMKLVPKEEFDTEGGQQ